MSGSALVWKESRVTLEDFGALPFQDSPQFLLYGKFLVDGKQIIFSQTHLKAGRGFNELRVKQTEAILNFFTENYSDLPVLVAGDFNDSPKTEPIKVMNIQFVDLFNLCQQNDSDQALTILHYREAYGVQKRTIDFIFTARNKFFDSHKLSVRSFLNMSDVQQKIETGEINYEMGNPNK